MGSLWFLFLNGTLVVGVKVEKVVHPDRLGFFYIIFLLFSVTTEIFFFKPVKDSILVHISSYSCTFNSKSMIVNNFMDDTFTTGVHYFRMWM